CGKRNPGPMRGGTIGAWCHQFHPEANRVCCLSLFEGGEHLFHPDITKSVIGNRYLDEARLHADCDPYSSRLGASQASFDPKACRTPMKCAPWTACDLVSCQEKASSRTCIQTRLHAVE